jgi:flagellin
MRINNNIMALNAHRQLGINQGGASKSMEKLSSGFRINRAGDDAAGLAISEKMRGDIRGLKQASRNAQEGISLIQTAEGALNETHSILQRMRELAVQSATDTNVNVDRDEIQKEIDQLASELTRISNTTEFNTQNLMAGSLDNVFHIGANSGQNVDLKIGAMDAKSLGVARDAKVAALTATNAAKLTGVSKVGSGLTNDNYSVIVTKSNAEVTGVSGGVVTNKVGTGADLTVGGNYTGRNDITNGGIIVEVSSTVGTDDASRASGIRVSFDGGLTFGNEITVSGTTAVNIGNGLTVSFADTQTDKGTTYSFGADAEKATIQLAEANGTTLIGDAVTVYNDQTSATIGQPATNGTLEVSFKFDSLTTSATNATSVKINTVESKAATFNSDKTIATEAIAAAGIDVSTRAAADEAISTINSAIETVSAERSMLGAMQNRLEHTIANLGTSAENLQAAEARIRDLDMAEEIMAFTKNNILQQAATAMLAQANMAPQSVLQLLG